jgi:hypothetical protein
MKYMAWDYEQLKRCKMRHYRAIVSLLRADARR